MDGRRTSRSSHDHRAIYPNMGIYRHGIPGSGDCHGHDHGTTAHQRAVLGHPRCLGVLVTPGHLGLKDETNTTKGK